METYQLMLRFDQIVHFVPCLSLITQAQKRIQDRYREIVQHTDITKDQLVFSRQIEHCPKCKDYLVHTYNIRRCLSCKWCDATFTNINGYHTIPNKYVPKYICPKCNDSLVYICGRRRCLSCGKRY